MPRDPINLLLDGLFKLLSRLMLPTAICMVLVACMLVW